MSTFVVTLTVGPILPRDSFPCAGSSFRQSWPSPPHRTFEFQLGVQACSWDLLSGRHEKEHKTGFGWHWNLAMPELGASVTLSLQIQVQRQQTGTRFSWASPPTHSHILLSFCFDAVLKSLEELLSSSLSTCASTSIPRRRRSRTAYPKVAFSNTPSFLTRITPTRSMFFTTGCPASS